jgi:hypothetical protein
MTKFVKGDPRLRPGHGARGQVRRDLTISLISQLDKMDIGNEPLSHKKRAYLNRIVENLVLQAAGQDYVDEKGYHRDTGDLMAIKEIWDRLEGKAATKIVGPNNEPVDIVFKSMEEIRVFLLDRGIDLLQLPSPMKVIEDYRARGKVDAD